MCAITKYVLPFHFFYFKIQKNTEINHSLSAGRIYPPPIVHTAPFGACQKTKCNYLCKSEYKTLINLILTHFYGQVKRELSETVACTNLKKLIEKHCL